jgi:hypothetical protein
MQGNVGIGTTSPDAPLTVQAGTNARAIRVLGRSLDGIAEMDFYLNDNTTLQARLESLSTSFNINTYPSIPITFKTAGTERMRITSGGFLKASNSGSYDSATSTVHELVSSTNGGQIAKFTHSGTVPYGMQINYSGASPNTIDNYFFICSDSTANRLIIWGNGNIQNQNNSYGALSDIKLKENIVDATPKLDDLMKVKIRNFNLIGDDNKQIGVIAQEIEKVFPSLVEDVKEKESEEKTKSVKYSVLVPIMLKAIQELKAEVDKLKQECKCKN